MKVRTIAKTVAALALACLLVACGKSTLELNALEEVSGVKVVAENAKADQVATSAGAITVADGDVIIISPCLDKGSFHLTITSSDGVTTVYDDDVDGRIMFQTGAVPDTYDVSVAGNNATGWMTVFATNADELGAQNDALAEALEEAGVDPSILSDGE